MQSNVPMVKLGDVLTLSKVPVTIDPLSLYKQVTVRLFHKGLMLREEKTGQEIQSNQWLVKKDQFLISRIDARNGAMGIVPPELDGAVVTNDFLRYDIDMDRLDVNFFDFLTSTENFVQQCARASEGTTNRKRLRPDLFLYLDIPLPSFEEQRRTVATLKVLIAKIEEARKEQAIVVGQTKALLLSALHMIFVKNSQDWDRSLFNEIIAVTDKQIDPTLPEYSGLPHISGENIESNTCRLLPYNTAMEDSVRSSNYLFSPGCVLYSKIRPYLRKSVYVDFTGVCSADIYPIRIIKDDIDLHFLKWTLVAEPFTEYANRLSGRTRMPKLNRKQLFNFEFSYPPLPEQRLIVAHLDRLQAKVDEVKRLQAETERDMVALVPAVLAKAFSTRTENA